MKYGLLIVFIGLSGMLWSQQCSCLDEFRFVKSHIERNHGGFNKKIKSANDPAYKQFTEGLEQQIRRLKDEQYCIAYLKKYILYLQDHHSNISPARSRPVDENSATELDSFFHTALYQSTEYIGLDAINVDEYLQKSIDPVEGIYQVPDTTYRVLIMKYKTGRRDYAGIILDSKSKLWSKGQVKLELNRQSDSVMQVYSYLRNHTLSYDEVAWSKNGISIPGWQKLGMGAQPIDRKLINFSILDSQTVMLSIRSFSSAIYKTLDSAYNRLIPVIKKYPHLIIDVRGNSGGADFSYAPLMPLLYTDKIYKDVIEMFVTPGNTAAYRLFDSISVKNGNGAVFERSIRLAERSEPYSFVSGSPERPVVRYATNKGYPKRIAVLYDRGCASSCEAFLFEARYSNKTILVGQNSGGFTGYGDVMNIQTPCGRQLSWTTTVYRDQWKYEFVGIPPHYKVPDTESDWVAYCRRLFDSHRW